MIIEVWPLLIIKGFLVSLGNMHVDMHACSCRLQNTVSRGVSGLCQDSGFCCSTIEARCLEQTINNNTWALVHGLGKVLGTQRQGQGTSHFQQDNRNQGLGKGHAQTCCLSCSKKPWGLPSLERECSYGLSQLTCDISCLTLTYQPATLLGNCQRIAQRIPQEAGNLCG